MEVQEAREKFGEVRTDGEENEHWEHKPNRIRGLVMKYARARDGITVPSEPPEAQHYIDDLWEWLQEKMGPGFEAVFQGDEMSPSGKFDRVSKDELEEMARGLYKNNDEFKDTIDANTTVVSGDDVESSGCSGDTVIGEEVGGDLAALAEMGHTDKIVEFFELDEDSDEHWAQRKEGPDVGSYKHYMKEYAREVKGIPASSDHPSADDFVDEWLSFLEEHIFKTTECIAQSKDSKFDHIFDTPTHSDVTEWARDLYRGNGRFRDNVKQKWGVPYSGESSGSSGGSGLSRPEDSPRNRDRKLRGKTRLTDFGD